MIATIEGPQIHYTEVIHESWRQKLINMFGTNSVIINTVSSEKLFSVGRFIWHYVIMEIHLMFNLMLIFWSVVDTPPLLAFAIALILSWIRIIIEIYRDKLHVDEIGYESRTGRQLSITSALHASLGFILKAKIENGVIGSTWWATWV
ncbi:unnamed protein product [Ambrosiozyma monospora]|uniref:Unnamed protein product n=1 Tax=Ambrosiozyma monospora TaxID=43982 RepID=A0A9W6YPJ3_AMBMO|nr:unnamed protein product [Ambrosiozyma monospora]